MKMFRCGLKFGCGFVLLLLALAPGATVFAQNNGSSVPTVTISATDPIARGPGDPGVFTVFRAGGTNAALNVYYLISGSASNGVDYAQISNWVLLPAGVISNSIIITPINNGPPAVTKTVSLQLAMPLTLNPVNYLIGSPSNATVFLAPPGTNLPPTVVVVNPTNNQVFYTPAKIPLMARATDPNGIVTNVEFFVGTNDLGRGLPVVLDPLAGGGISGLVYFLNWQNVPTNTYSLTAVATDNGGLSATSNPVNITVLAGTNPPPVVRITSPPDGSVFRAPVNLPIYAYAADPADSVSSVEFFAGSNLLGFGQRVTAVPPPVPPGAIQPPILIVVSNYWELVWTNATMGTNFALTALATDNAGLSSTSAPVFISVLPSPPPPTNRPPIVTIVATDPVAIEGTNCWTWLGLTNSPPTWSNWVGATATSLIRFTNCGPKNATFAVFRNGATNDDLNVSYNVGGTASNGVDYVALPGAVVIPASERRALITIVPIDDGPPDVNKTVLLTLTPPTNTPPDYLVGTPRTAAAIIVDSNGPRPVTGMLPGNCFHLVTPGPNAAWFCIEWSTNMVHWLPVCTNQVINGSIDFVDPDAPGNPSRFYRAVPLTNPPAD